jgi:hypothetical protein
MRKRMRRRVRVAFALCAVAWFNFVDPHEGTAQKILLPSKAAGNGMAVLWRQPNNIASRDLLHGVGGKQNQPLGTFTFVKEDSGGSTPKFIVEDSLGRRWKAKLGPEAGAETTATRLLWVVGYFTKADLKGYRKGKFLEEVSAEEVDLRLPTRPPCRYLCAFPFYIQRTRLGSIAADLPRHDVEWIGQLLAQLSTRQISDAFRAGGFQPGEVEGFTQEVQRRISELRRLM